MCRPGIVLVFKPSDDLLEVSLINLVLEAV